MAEIVRRRSWGGVLPLGLHVSISGCRAVHAPSVSIAPSSFQEEQNARHHKQFKREQALTLQLQSMLISESLGHHDSEIMDGSWIGRGDAGAVGVVVAGRQGANPAAVPAGTDGAIRGVVPGRSARARAAQDGLDAGGSGG